MTNSVYLTGFRDNDLSSEEVSKVDEYKQKYSGKINILDNRDDNFKPAFETFKSEGKHIVIYAEAEESLKDEMIGVAKELQSALSDVKIEVNDEKSQLL